MSRLLRALLFLFSPDRIFKADECYRTDIVIKSFNLQQIVTVCCCTHKAKSKRSEYTGQSVTHSVVRTFSNSSKGRAHWACYSRGGLGTDSRSETKQRWPWIQLQNLSLWTLFKAIDGFEKNWLELWCRELCTNQESDACPEEKNNEWNKEAKISPFISKKWLICCWDEFPSTDIHSHFYFCLCCISGKKSTFLHKSCINSGAR